METKTQFNAEAFQRADDMISNYIQLGSSDSQTIKDVIDEVNNIARVAVAKEKFSHPIIQVAYKTVLSLMGKDAAAITADQSKSVESILKECEKHVKGINKDIGVKSAEHENLLSRLESCKDNVDAFEFGIQGYHRQLEEISEIISAKHQGKNPSEVNVRALDVECYDMEVSRLRNLRLRVQTKLRGAQLQLNKLYFNATSAAAELNQTQRTIQVLEAQHNNSLHDISRQLEQQCGFYSPDFITICKQQLERASLQERVEQKVNLHSRVVEQITTFLDSNMDTILNPYRARFYNARDGLTAGKRIDEVLDKWTEQGEIGRESMRTRAYAGFNEFLD